MNLVYVINNVSRKSLLCLKLLDGIRDISLTVREEHKLRAFVNRVLRKIFGPKTDGVMGGWRTLHNEELHNLYSLPNIIRILMSRRMRWAGHVTRMGEKKNVYRLLVRKPEGERPLGRTRHRWIDNIKTDLFRDWIECCGLEWSGSG
jgi:hypothetical protein